jgi:poly(A) polymerase
MMTEPSESQRPKSTREDAVAVVRRLRESGHVAYFAGGCVRDMLLGREPKDFDVATDAPPKRVRGLFSNTQAVGAAFGVILVRHRTSQIEVATFRTEGGYTDGRHPTEVRFTTAEEDAKRRDFTINGLFLDPVNDQVIDYVGGRQDLQEGRIRAIGIPAERFEEDSLRLLRAIRFSARFNFPIEPQTAAAIVAHAPQLKRISPERIAEELRIMLTATTRAAAWHMLWELGLIETLFRFFHFTRRKPPAGGSYLFDAVAPDEPISFGLALAAAVVCYRIRTDTNLRDVRSLFSRAEVQSAVKVMRQTLKISNEESEEMRGTLAGLEPLLADRIPGIAKLKRFLAEPTAPLSRKMLEALAGIGTHTDRIRELERQLADLERTEFAPTPLIDGDLLTEHGLRPGPVFKRILDAVYDAQLEGRVNTREEAIALALQMGGTT